MYFLSLESLLAHATDPRTIFLVLGTPQDVLMPGRIPLRVLRIPGPLLSLLPAHAPAGGNPRLSLQSGREWLRV